jgi:hypothetical protein
MKTPPSSPSDGGMTGVMICIAIAGFIWILFILWLLHRRFYLQHQPDRGHQRQAQRTDDDEVGIPRDNLQDTRGMTESELVPDTEDLKSRIPRETYQTPQSGLVGDNYMEQIEKHTRQQERERRRLSDIEENGEGPSNWVQ